MNWLLNPLEGLKGMIDNLLSGLLADYNTELSREVTSLLNTVKVILTGTPNILDNNVLKVILSFTTNVALLLTAIGFVFSINAAVIGFLSGGTTIRKAIFRFIVTVLLVGSAGDICLNIIRFSDDMVVSAQQSLGEGFSDQIVQNSLEFNSGSIMNKIDGIHQQIVRQHAIFDHTLSILIACCILWALGIYRIIELSYLTAIAPLMLACLVNEYTRSITIAFLKEFIFVALKTFFYYLILAFYLGLFSIGSFAYAMSDWIVSPIYIILLLIAIFKLPEKTAKLIGVNGGFDMIGSVRTIVTVAKFAA